MLSVIECNILCSALVNFETSVVEESNMEDINLREVQLKSLEILLYFKKFCEEHDLTFFFCGGCCLGTIRHKGFIPWDDDIDVFMYREDYEALKKLWDDNETNEKYILCRSDTDNFYRSQLTAIVDKNTTFIKENQKDLNIPHGIRLEILPLDGCPTSKFKRMTQLFWGLVYQLFCLQQPPTSKGKIFELAGKLALSIIPTWEKRTRVWKYAEKQMSKYPIEKCDVITELCVRWNYMKNEYPKEIFSEVIYKEFEGYQMPIPVGYDQYLKTVFGNYMELPSMEKRVTCHDSIKVDCKNGYKCYKELFGTNSV